MFQAEDSRVYWLPDMKRYGRIKPRLSISMAETKPTGCGRWWGPRANEV